MPRIIIIIHLPRKEGSPLNDEIFTKAWLSGGKSPIGFKTIPHTGDKCTRLVLVEDGKDRWSISFECKTEICYETGKVHIIAEKALCVSCSNKNFNREPIGGSQKMLESFVTALLKDGWVNNGKHFKHLKPK